MIKTTLSTISLILLVALALNSCNYDQKNTHQKSTVTNSFNKTTLASTLVNLNFNIEAARGTEGYLSLCTDYLINNNQYDINYDSCKLSTSLENGHYNSSIKLKDNVQSIIGVVLFDDISIEPIYKEFNLSRDKKIALRQNKNTHVLSWN